jgi:hypothetical protein
MLRSALKSLLGLATRVYTGPIGSSTTSNATAT